MCDEFNHYWIFSNDGNERFHGFRRLKKIMKNFIFAFILFALLLTVNAAPFQLNKRAITFSACPPERAPNAEAIDVKMTGPDPPKSGDSDTFDVSGTLTKHDITSGKTSVGIAYADLTGNPIGDPFVQQFTKDIKAGSPFSESGLSVTAPDNLPDSYAIAVVVADDATKEAVYGCAFALVGA
ncbi:hypothetical protein C2G38_2181231 [Gigaspora rosea]|uniref:MD-2-related lipid-recognition domain-containing protein n=1 Tax=Gigaspora rosea TaxID=44941 RepID=A0A397VKI3_9GLOM|nr:hypothetical protein C2G38_2181231 [Gigaspora rosea]